MQALVYFVQCGKSLEWLLLSAGFVGLVLVTFLSLRASPATSTVRWLPRFITHWADRHGQFCNFPAYAGLTVPFVLLARNRRQRLLAAAGLCLLGATLETCQRWIPTRFFDWYDILWSCAGVLATWGVSEVLVSAAAALRQKFTS